MAGLAMTHTDLEKMLLASVDRVGGGDMGKMEMGYVNAPPAAPISGIVGDTEQDPDPAAPGKSRHRGRGGGARGGGARGRGRGRYAGAAQ